VKSELIGLLEIDETDLEGKVQKRVVGFDRSPNDYSVNALVQPM